MKFVAKDGKIVPEPKPQEEKDKEGTSLLEVCTLHSLLEPDIDHSISPSTNSTNLFYPISSYSAVLPFIHSGYWGLCIILSTESS